MEPGQVEQGGEVGVLRGPVPSVSRRCAFQGTKRGIVPEKESAYRGCGRIIVGAYAEKKFRRMNSFSPS